MKKTSQFTLLEILITVTIIGILAGILATGITSATEKGKGTNLKAFIATLDMAISKYYNQNGRYPASDGKDKMYRTSNLYTALATPIEGGPYISKIPEEFVGEDPDGNKCFITHERYEEPKFDYEINDPYYIVYIPSSEYHETGKANGEPVALMQKQGDNWVYFNLNTYQLYTPLSAGHYIGYQQYDHEDYVSNFQ